MNQPPFSAIPQEKPRPRRRKVVKFVREQIKKRDFHANIVFFGGLLTASAGFWQIYHPLGLIVGGSAATYVGLVMAGGANEPRK